MKDLTYEQLDKIYLGDKTLAKELLGHEICGACLPFDSSDPVPKCLKPKNHDGPHVVDGCIEFTEESNAKRIVQNVTAQHNSLKRTFPDTYKDTLEEAFTFFGCDTNGYPSKIKEEDKE